MKPHSAFPQHPLKDQNGKNTDFHYSPWGLKTENYDIEKPHRHQFYEILFFHSGNGIHDIDFNTHKARNRSIHFVAPDNVHLLLRDNKSSGCSLLFVASFPDAGLLSQLPFNSLMPALRPDAVEYKRILALLGEIKTEYNSTEPDKFNMIKSMLQLLFSILLRNYKREQPDSSSSDVRPEVLRQFIGLLGRSFDKHMSVKQYAEILNVSDKYLIEICKQHTGKTPLKHIHEFTVSEAKKLLFNSSLSVKEIAYKLNFDDPANFTRYFKSVTGYSPVEYREGIR